MFKIKSFKKKESVGGVYIRGKTELPKGSRIRLHGELYFVDETVDAGTDKEVVRVTRIDGVSGKYHHIPNGAPFQFYY